MCLCLCISSQVMAGKRGSPDGGDGWWCRYKRVIVGQVWLSPMPQHAFPITQFIDANLESQVIYSYFPVAVGIVRSLGLPAIIFQPSLLLGSQVKKSMKLLQNIITHLLTHLKFSYKQRKMLYLIFFCGLISVFLSFNKKQ